MTDHDLDPTVRGNQPAGPARWARAKQWAELHPHTKPAAKYRERVATADEMAARLPSGKWQHYRRGGKGGKHVYTGQTCSTRCAMLQLQVNSGCTGLEELASYVVRDNPPYFVTERPADSKRTGRCMVCWEDVV